MNGDETLRRVRAAAKDASSNDDLVRDGWEAMSDQFNEQHPLDEVTLDEQASTQLGEMFDSRRRDAS